MDGYSNGLSFYIRPLLYLHTSTGKKTYYEHTATVGLSQVLDNNVGLSFQQTETNKIRYNNTEQYVTVAYHLS